MQCIRNKLINVYKKSEEDYILHGQIKNVENHGNNSNAMTKINDNIFCCGGKNGFIYIVSVEPAQVIQKINLGDSDNSDYVGFLHNSNDGFIFTSFEDKIIQLKIFKDEEDNFINLQKYDQIQNEENNEAIIAENGKIFYKSVLEKYSYDKSLFVLGIYKNDNIYEFEKVLDKCLNF